MLASISSWNNWAKEKGQAALTKIKPTLMRVRRRIEVLPENTITLGTLGATTVIAWISKGFIFVTHMASKQNYYIHCEAGYREGNEGHFDHVLGFKVDSSRDFIYHALLWGATAFALLQVVRAKRRALVEKVEAANHAKTDLQKIKKVHNSVLLPTPVSDLLSLIEDSANTDSKILSEKEKFKILENYIQGGYSSEVLCDVLDQGRLSEVRDEENHTLLHVAAGNGNIDLVKRLLSTQFKLSPFAQNKKGIIPRTLAYDSDKPVVAEILSHFEILLQAQVVPYDIEKTHRVDVGSDDRKENQTSKKNR